MADYHGSISKINIEYGVGQVELLSEQHGMFGQKVSNHVGFFECLRAHTLNRPIISSQTWTPIRSRTGVPQVAPTGVPQEWNYGWGDTPVEPIPTLHGIRGPACQCWSATCRRKGWRMVHSFASVVWRQQKQTQIFVKFQEESSKGPYVPSSYFGSLPCPTGKLNILSRTLRILNYLRRV